MPSPAGGLSDHAGGGAGRPPLGSGPTGQREDRSEGPQHHRQEYQGADQSPCDVRPPRTATALGEPDDLLRLPADDVEPDVVDEEERARDEQADDHAGDRAANDDPRDRRTAAPGEVADETEN